MSQFISLQEAVDMTSLYREERETLIKSGMTGQPILCLSETFERSDVESLLGKAGCEGLRIYYGMSPDQEVHALLVAVDASGADMLSSAAGPATASADDVLNRAIRCPETCPPSSPLNP